MEDPRGQMSCNISVFMTCLLFWGVMSVNYKDDIRVFWGGGLFVFVLFCFFPFRIKLQHYKLEKRGFSKVVFAQSVHLSGT